MSCPEHPSQCWTPAPDPLSLEPGSIHVYRFPLDPAADSLAALRATLSPDEIARAERFHFARDRRRFIVARGQLRAILARLLQAGPTALVFDYNEFGKPAVANALDLRFNLSHSGELALLAVSLGLNLGVDVETVRAESDRLNLARRFFAPGEVDALLALPAEQQMDAFYACWTRKEAYLKALGSGLSASLKSFQVSLAPGEPARLLSTERGSAEDWTLADLRPGEGYAAALAVEGRPEAIHCWTWS